MADQNTPNGPPKGGLRKDGKPYKEGNTRPDGSYELGKYRPSPEHQFRAGDGRKRGKRAKGTKNLLTDWREELDAKVTITKDGKAHKITKRRALIKNQIRRGIEKSDRAAETALRYAELSEKRDPGMQADDLAIIAAWLESTLRQHDAENEGNDGSSNAAGGVADLGLDEDHD